jgi:hypothetical protein
LIAEQELTGQRIRELINADRRSAFASQQPPAAVEESAFAGPNRRPGS